MVGRARAQVSRRRLIFAKVLEADLHWRCISAEHRLDGGPGASNPSAGMAVYRAVVSNREWPSIAWTAGACPKRADSEMRVHLGYGSGRLRWIASGARGKPARKSQEAGMPCKRHRL